MVVKVGEDCKKTMIERIKPKGESGIVVKGLKKRWNGRELRFKLQFI